MGDLADDLTDGPDPRDTTHRNTRLCISKYSFKQATHVHFMESDCSMHAIMLKKGRGRVSSLVRPWKERLIVLHAHTMKIAYYTVPSASCEWMKRGELSLVRCGVTCLPSSTSGKAFTFQITSADGELLLSAASPTQRDEWIHAITMLTARQAQGNSRRELGGILTLPHAHRKRPKERKELLLDCQDEMSSEYISPSSSCDSRVLSSFDYSNSSSSSTRNTLWSLTSSESSASPSSMQSPCSVVDAPDIPEAIPSEAPPDYSTSWEIYTKHKRQQNKALLLELKQTTEASEEELMSSTPLSLYLNLNAQRRDWQLRNTLQAEKTLLLSGVHSPRSPRTC